MPPPVHAPPAIGFERGHERIAAVVEVEQRALGALEQDVVAPGERVLDEPDRVGEVRLEALAPGDRLGDQRARARTGHRRAAGPGRAFLSGSDPRQRVARKERSSSRSSTRRPIRSARSAYAGPIPRWVVPDGLAAEPRLQRRVQGDVVGHDHVGVPADPDLGRRRCRALGEHVQLVDQRRRVDHDARPDHRA